MARQGQAWPGQAWLWQEIEEGRSLRRALFFIPEAHLPFNPEPSSINIAKMLNRHTPTVKLPGAMPIKGGGMKLPTPRIGRQIGGAIPDSPAQPFTGPIVHPGGGRTDDVPIHVPQGSYVLPADIVSHIGEGNSFNGLTILKMMFSPNPWGATAGPQGSQNFPMPRGSGPPKPVQPRVGGFPRFQVGPGVTQNVVRPQMGSDVGLGEARQSGGSVGSIADRYISRSGQSAPRAPSRLTGAASIADRYISPSGGVPAPPAAPAPSSPAYEPTSSPGYSPQTQQFISRQGGVGQAQAWMQNNYPGGPPRDATPQLQTIHSELMRPMTAPQAADRAPVGLQGAEEGMMQGREAGALAGDRYGGPVRQGGQQATPIMASGGEFVIPPREVARRGGGDIGKGHRILDHWVKSLRKESIKTLQKLPGPAR